MFGNGDDGDILRNLSEATLIQVGLILAGAWLLIIEILSQES